MIERFILPEWLAHPTEYCVRLTSGIVLDRFRNLGKRRLGLYQDMNVIRHQDPCGQFVEPQRLLAVPECIDHGLGYARIEEPFWAGRGPVQGLLDGFGGLTARRNQVRNVRQRAVQSPGDK